MKKVTLVGLGIGEHENPFFPGYFYVTSSSLHYLSHILTNSGFNVNIINQVVDGLTLDNIIQLIEENTPDIILFNQFYSTRDDVKTISSHYQEKCIIGIGGHDVTFHSRNLSADNLRRYYGHADFIWRGEAENNLAEFLGTFKKQNRVVLVDNLNNRVTDLETLPVLKHDDYCGDKGFIVTSRGCYTDGCEFCTTPVFYNDGIRYRSAEHIEQELQNLSMAGKKLIYIFDDNFLGFSRSDLLNRMKIVDECRQLDLKLYIMTRPEQIVRASKMGLLQEMAGTVVEVFLGVENGSPAVLKKIGKKCDPISYRKTCEQAIECLTGAEISIYLGYINFYPESTFEELEASLEFLHGCGQFTSIFHYLCNKLQLYEGIPLKVKYESGVSPIRYRNRNNLDYRFFHEGVDFLNTYLEKYVAPITQQADFLDYETNFLIHLNQMCSDDITRDYQKLKKRLSAMNYDFFKEAIEVCRNYPDAFRIVVLKDEFLADVTKMVGENRKLLTENLNRFEIISRNLASIIGNMSH